MATMKSEKMMAMALMLSCAGQALAAVDARAPELPSMEEVKASLGAGPATLAAPKTQGGAASATTPSMSYDDAKKEFNGDDVPALTPRDVIGKWSYETMALAPLQSGLLDGLLGPGAAGGLGDLFNGLIGAYQIDLTIRQTTGLLGGQKLVVSESMMGINAEERPAVIAGKSLQFRYRSGQNGQMASYECRLTKPGRLLCLVGGRTLGGYMAFKSAAK